MPSDSMPAEVRLAELLAALSLAIDLGMGQKQEHVMRTCLLAVTLARQLGLNMPAVSDVYYVTLLRLVGCTADAHETAAIAAGDDLAFRERVALHTMGTLAELESVVRTFGGSTQSHDVIAARTAALTAHCEAGERLAAHLGLPPHVCKAVACGFAAWSGDGVPALAGAAIPVSSRIAIAARDLEIVTRVSGVAAAQAFAQERSGRAYDPQVVDAFQACGGAFVRLATEGDVWDRVLAAEPHPRRRVADDGLDDTLMAFALFADLKSPFTMGHSGAVADLAASAAAGLGLSQQEASVVRRAGYVHDLGRVGVPNGIWDKPGSLTPLEWERVRLHPYFSERILERCTPLRDLARLAGAHHERLDGSGYHRGSRASEQPLTHRVLAAADVFRSLTEPRPYRARHSTPSATRVIRAAAAAGQLDRHAVEAVVSVAQHTGSPHPRGRTSLTARELEVLRLVGRGYTNTETARMLGISAKTVGHHIQHIYEKLGVSTRAAATLAAVQHGLLEF